MQDAVSNETQCSAPPPQPEKVKCAGCGHSKLPFLFTPSQLDRASHDAGSAAGNPEADNFSLEEPMQKRKEEPKRAPFVPCGSCHSGYTRVIRDGVSFARECSCLRNFKNGAAQAPPPVSTAYWWQDA